MKYHLFPDKGRLLSNKAGLLKNTPRVFQITPGVLPFPDFTRHFSHVGHTEPTKCVKKTWKIYGRENFLFHLQTTSK